MQSNVGLIGIGTIGSGVVKLIQKNSELIEKRSGVKLNLAKVCDKKLDNAQSLGLKDDILTDDYKEIINDEKINLVIELIGGYEPARTIILEALKKGKSVVT